MKPAPPVTTIDLPSNSKDNEVNKVIYSSSSSVYGDTPVLPKQENMVTDPQSPYVVAKLDGEYYCEVYY